MSDDYLDYKIITIYPTLAYVFYLFCKKYYKYISVLDNFEQYDMCYVPFKTDYYEKMETNNDYYNNIAIAFNHIPT